VQPAPAPPKDESRPVAGRRGGFAGLVLGGAAAAAIGAGAAIWLVPGLREQADDTGLAAKVAELDTKAAGLGAELSGLRTELDGVRAAAEVSGTGLKDRLDKLEAAVAAASAPDEDLRAAIEAMDARLAALDARLATVEKRPGPGGTVSSAAIDAFQRDLDALRADLDAQKRETEAAREALAAATADATESMETVRAEAERLQAEAQDVARRATVTAAIGQLRAALESGSPVGPALAGLAEAGIEVPEALKEQEGGVPTLDYLKSAYPEAARNALAAALQAAPATTWGERLSNFLRSQTGARSLTPKAGDDPDAILSRAEAALSANDLPAALAEIETLPGPAREVLDEWVGLATRRIAAQEAVDALAVQAQ